MKELGSACNPKDVIRSISEDLLARFLTISLLDKYDIYQYLMQYWEEVMQDDVYQISADGWKKAAKLRLLVDEKGKDKKLKETPDIVIGRGAAKFMADLIPPALLVARYYPIDQKAIENLESDKGAIEQELEEFIEEHSGEDGLIEHAKNHRGKLTKSILKERIREIKCFNVFDDELKILRQVQRLLNKESTLGKQIKDKKETLNNKLVLHYENLSEDEIKFLVVHDKWFTRLTADVQGEVDRVVQGLASRVKELEERYACPMPELARKVDEYTTRVETHLKKMGLNW